MRFVIAALMAFGAVLSAHAQDAVIHAGKVLAVPGEGYLSEQTILIRDGRIVSVDPGYHLPADNVRVIDLKNAFVLPGLIDAHVHLLSEFSPNVRLEAVNNSEADLALSGAQNAHTTLMAGFTSVQDVGGVNEAIFSLRDAIRAGKVPGPRIRASGRAITPTGGHGDVNGYSPAVRAALSLVTIRAMALMIAAGLCARRSATVLMSSRSRRPEACSQTPRLDLSNNSSMTRSRRLSRPRRKWVAG